MVGGWGPVKILDGGVDCASTLRHCRPSTCTRINITITRRLQILARTNKQNQSKMLARAPLGALFSCPGVSSWGRRGCLDLGAGLLAAFCSAALTFASSALWRCCIAAITWSFSLTSVDSAHATCTAYFFSNAGRSIALNKSIVPRGEMN